LRQAPRRPSHLRDDQQQLARQRPVADRHERAIAYKLQIIVPQAEITIPADSVQTVRVELRGVSRSFFLDRFPLGITAHRASP
jgi:hypothetical protein